MRLRKLTIRKLPGIEPEFTLNEIGAGVNLVVGPNAIGKSSLTRALKYLLGNSGDDPPALSLEAELEDGETRWQVTRNGSHIAWRRDGARRGDGPVLPGADQFGLYRLSVESLLDAGDAHDKNLAALLRRKLFGDCDLDALREEIQAPTGPRFGRRESRALVEAGRERRQVVGDYAALERQEADLPALQRRIDAAEAAGSLRQHLEQALKLADAIAAHKACGEQLTHFSPEMSRLQGEELKQLDAREEQAAKLREELRTRQGELESAKAELERTGLAQATPAAEQLQAVAAKLRTLDKLAIDHGNARDAATTAKTAAQDARAQLGGSSEPPRIDADACRRAEDLVSRWIAAQTQHTELEKQRVLAGEAPDPQEIYRLRDGATALRDWLTARKVEAEPQAPAPLWPSFVAAGSAAAAAVAAGWAGYLQAALGFWRTTRGRSQQSVLTADAERRFRDAGLDPPPSWDQPAVRRHLREVEDEWDRLRVQQKRAEGAERIRTEIEASEEKLRRLKADKDALAAEIGFDPTLPAAAFDRFVRLSTNWDQARKQHADQTARAADLEQQINEAARGVREFLDAWPADDAGGSHGDSAVAEAAGNSAGDDAEDPPDLDLLRSTFDRLQQRVSAAETVRNEILNRATGIESLTRQLAAQRAKCSNCTPAPGSNPAIAPRSKRA